MVDDGIRLKEWPRHDDAYVLGQKFTGRIICQNISPDTDITLSFRAVETLEVREPAGVSKRRNVLFESIQRAGRRAAAVRTRDRLEWWFEMATPKLCDKSHSVTALGLDVDERYVDAVPCPLPPSFPARAGASIGYEFVLEIDRTEPHQKRVLRCGLPFIAGRADDAPAAKPERVVLAENYKTRGRNTLESQFRILLPDDPELQVPSRIFDAHLHIPSAISPGRPSHFLVSLKHLGLSSEGAEQDDPTFKLAQLRLYLRGITTYRYKSSDGMVETRTVRGNLKRFDWWPEFDLELPKNGDPVLAEQSLSLPLYSKDPTLVPGFTTCDVRHTHELTAEVFIKHSITGHFYSITSDQAFPITLLPSFISPDEILATAATTGARPVTSNGELNGGADVHQPLEERVLPLEDLNPALPEPAPEPAAPRRATTTPSISEASVTTTITAQSTRRGSFTKRFSLGRLNSWRKSTGLLSPMTPLAKPDKGKAPDRSA